MQTIGGDDDVVALLIAALEVDVDAIAIVTGLIRRANVQYRFSKGCSKTSGPDTLVCSLGSGSSARCY
jgi:hypothetical protein